MIEETNQESPYKRTCTYRAIEYYYYFPIPNSDVFSFTIGNLAPNTGVTITIKYVVVLMTEEDCTKLRLVFPLTIMTRYPGFYSHRVIDHRGNPIDRKPFNLTIGGSIYFTDGVVSVDSKTHKIKIIPCSYTTQRFEDNGIEELDKDIVLTLERGKQRTSVVTTEMPTNEGSIYKHCTTVNLVPDFSRLKPVDMKNVHYVIVLDSSIYISESARQQFNSS